MNNRDIPPIFTILQENKKRWQDSTLESLEKDPFIILTGCILSLRTKDPLTLVVAKRLLGIARTPEQILQIPEDTLSEIIYPVGFYRRKARTLRNIAQILWEQHQGKVPDTLDELLELPGVGRKTANLVITVAFGKPGISVDTHVHRIVNRWGYVNTPTPDKTEMALREKLPLEYWIPVNSLLVLFGQNVCLPRYPRCPICPLKPFCEQIGVNSGKPAS
ncbi:MAG: endonuclease III [Candidatus Atribacteria bacterium]|nr:endonuclease III [Candidatus Atribacteria bacterium]